jgi:lipoate-protein ligase A
MKLELYESHSFNPYENLGAEAYLLETCPPDTLRFYLWQNAHTVVISTKR